MGEIARGAKDHNGARLGHWPSGKPFPKRVWFRLISGSMHDDETYSVPRSQTGRKFRAPAILWR
jgi:hypothetical protein